MEGGTETGEREVGSRVRHRERQRGVGKREKKR